jgi:hypothetical protein
MSGFPFIGHRNSDNNLESTFIISTKILRWYSILYSFYIYINLMLNFTMIIIFGSWDSVVGIATGYGLDDRRVGVRIPEGSRSFSSLRRPDRLWVPPSLLSNEYRGFFSWGKAAETWSWPHLQLVPRSRKVDLYIHSPIRLHGVVLYYLSTGTNLPFLPSYFIILHYLFIVGYHYGIFIILFH